MASRPVAWPLQITFASPVSLRKVTSRASFASSGNAATATFSIGGSGVINVSGTLSGSALTMTGAGWTINGTLNHGEIKGTFTGPAEETGSLAAISSTTSAPAAAYCGRYDGTRGASRLVGTFNLLVAGTRILYTFAGDSMRAGTATSSSFSSQYVSGPFEHKLSGTYDASSTSGTWSSWSGSPHFQAAGSSGSFSANICE